MREGLPDQGFGSRRAVILGRRLAKLLRAAALAGLAVGGTAAPPAVADEPHLPAAPPPVAPLRRLPNGQIEVINPATAARTGRPLCDRGALCVGRHQRYHTLGAALAVAHAGATIELVAGTYRESALLNVKNLTLRGVAGRPHIDCAGIVLAGDRACLLVGAPGITLDNLEVSGNGAATSGGGACIANEPGLGFHLHGIICHGAMNGVVADGGDLVIEDSEFYDNGFTAGASNAAFTGGCLVTIRGTIFRDARRGDEVLSRCLTTNISDSTVRSSRGRTDLDLPEGGDTVIYRSTLEKREGAAGTDILRFGSEGCRHPGGVLLKDVRVVTSMTDAAIRNFDTCADHAIVLDHVSFAGPPVKWFGYILRR